MPIWKIYRRNEKYADLLLLRLGGRAMDCALGVLIYAAGFSMIAAVAGRESVPDIKMPSHADGTAEQASRMRSEMQVAKITGDTSDNLLQHHSRYLAWRRQLTLVGGSETWLLIDGPQTYGAMLTAMEAARDHINLEIYILEDDEVGQKLQQAVIRVYEFNPVNPAKGKVQDLNNGDHRKLLIVDGKIGFAGGISISNVYAQGSGSNRWFRSKGSQKASVASGWRDTQVEVRGPAVAAMQRVFLDTWNQQSDDKRRAANGRELDYFPQLSVAGDKMVRVIASAAGDAENGIYVDLMSAIQQASAACM